MIAGSYEVGGPRGHELLKIKLYVNDALFTFIWLLCYYYDVCYGMGGVEIQEAQLPRSVIR